MLKILLVVLVLVLVGGGYYFWPQINQQLNPQLSPVTVVQPTPTSPIDLTANWKTITFNKVTLKVPSEFWVHEDPKDTIIHQGPFPTGFRGDAVPSFELTIKNNTTVEEIIANHKNDTVEDIVLDNKKAVKVKHILEKGFDVVDHTYYYVYIQVDKDVYKFTAADYLLKEKLDKTLDQILSTFKFTQ